MHTQMNKLKFFLERLLLRGIWFHVLIMAFLIVFISLSAGFLAYVFTPDFGSLGKSAWWAFLRLSDPGYLGDDEGLFLLDATGIGVRCVPAQAIEYVLDDAQLVAVFGRLEIGDTDLCCHVLSVVCDRSDPAGENPFGETSLEMIRLSA